MTPRLGSSCFKTYEAIAPATRRTFSNVKSSAMIARQPSVPNLMGADGWSEDVVGPRSLVVGASTVVIRCFGTHLAVRMKLANDQQPTTIFKPICSASSHPD